MTFEDNHVSLVDNNIDVNEIIIENVIENFEMKKNLESDTVQITNDIDMIVNT